MITLLILAAYSTIGLAAAAYVLKALRDDFTDSGYWSDPVPLSKALFQSVGLGIIWPITGVACFLVVLKHRADHDGRGCIG